MRATTRSQEAGTACVPRSGQAGSRSAQNAAPSWSGAQAMTGAQLNTQLSCGPNAVRAESGAHATTAAALPRHSGR